MMINVFALEGKLERKFRYCRYFETFGGEMTNVKKNAYRKKIQKIFLKLHEFLPFY